jgi:hypothetical protein
MPLNDEVKTLLGDKFNEDALVEMLTPDVTNRLSSTHVIRTKEDDESYVSTKAKELKDQEIGSHVGSLHQMYEDQIAGLGFKKNSNEKTSDFQKRVLSELKLKADASTGGDEVLKQQIQTLTASIAELEAKSSQEKEELHNKYFKRQVDGLLSSALGGVTIALPSTVKTDAEKQAFADQQRGLIKLQLTTNYTIKEDNDGNVVFYKGDVLQSSAKDGKPLTANEIITRDFSSYIEVQGRQQGGAGSSGGVKTGSFSTRAEVYEHLKAEGMEEGTNAFTKAAAKIIKEHGIVK